MVINASQTRLKPLEALSIESLHRCTQDWSDWPCATAFNYSPGKVDGSADDCAAWRIFQDATTPELGVIAELLLLICSRQPRAWLVQGGAGTDGCVLKCQTVVVLSLCGRMSGLGAVEDGGASMTRVSVRPTRPGHVRARRALLPDLLALQPSRLHFGVDDVVFF